MPVAEATRLCQIGGGKSLMYLAPTAITPVMAADADAAKLRQYPVPLYVLAEFVAAVVAAATADAARQHAA